MGWKKQGAKPAWPLLFLNNKKVQTLFLHPVFFTPYFWVPDPKIISGRPDKLDIRVQIDWSSVLIYICFWMTVSIHGLASKVAYWRYVSIWRKLVLQYPMKRGKWLEKIRRRMAFEGVWKVLQLGRVDRWHRLVLTSTKAKTTTNSSSESTLAAGRTHQCLNEFEVSHFPDVLGHPEKKRDLKLDTM